MNLIFEVGPNLEFEHLKLAGVGAAPPAFRP